MNKWINIIIEQLRHFERPVSPYDLIYDLIYDFNSALSWNLIALIRCHYNNFIINALN